MLSSGCGFSSLNSGFISGPHGIPWQLQALPHRAQMTAMAPLSTSSWWQAQWERGRAFSKSFKQNAQDRLSSELVTEAREVARSGSNALPLQQRVTLKYKG